MDGSSADFWPFYFIQTKGLSLEEIGAKFGDEVAVDITHLSEEDKRRLDKKLKMGVDVAHVEDAGAEKV